VAREIFTYVLRDMTHKEGGFYSAEDADSEGEEGVFYIWSKEELIEILGPEDGSRMAKIFGFSDNGNFRDEASGKSTGNNIPYFTVGTKVSDIEAAFNYARGKDSTINKKLTLPSQDVWDAMSQEERALYILNQERYGTLTKQVKAGKISKLLFILDADKDFGATKADVEKLQENLNIINISDYLIMCDSKTKQGYLESLILETLPDEHKKCINSFLDCSGAKRNAKHIVKSMYEQYYPDKGYNFEHENFKPLNDKLLQLFTQEPLAD